MVEFNGDNGILVGLIFKSAVASLVVLGDTGDCGADPEAIKLLEMVLIIADLLILLPDRALSLVVSFC